MTDWRVRFRRDMNERNSEANTKAIDSLLNFETVKYFANEEHEARRYDAALRAYEQAAVKSETTLAALNIGQGMIIAVGLVGVMLLAAQGVAARVMTVGDFVLVNAYLIQLYTPLNFLGVVYRNIKQSLDRSRADDGADGGAARDRGPAGGAGFVGRARPRSRFAMSISAMTRGGRSCSMSISACRPGQGRDRRPERRRQVDDRAAAVPLLGCRSPARSRSTARTSAR